MHATAHTISRLLFKHLLGPALLLFGATTPVFADTPSVTPSVAGQAIVAETQVDVAEIIRVVDALDAAVDAKDWATARGLFTDRIEVDFTSLFGGEPASIPADGLIASWSDNLKPSKTSFHLRGNHRVTFIDRDRAILQSHGYAWNRMEAGALAENGGNPLWEVWGTYEHRLVRTGKTWKIAAMTLTISAERGNPYVRNTVPES